MDPTLVNLADQLQDILHLCDRLTSKCRVRVNSARPNIFNIVFEKLKIIKAETTYALGVVEQEKIKL
jgi:hypothetical protein